MNAKHKDSSRRDFLKQLVRLGAAGAFFATYPTASASPGPSADRPAPPARQRSQGYRLTRHIQTYYEKAAT